MNPALLAPFFNLWDQGDEIYVIVDTRQVIWTPTTVDTDTLQDSVATLRPDLLRYLRDVCIKCQ